MTLRQCGLLAVVSLVGALAQSTQGQAQGRQDPIVLEKSGGFVIGGKVI